MSSYDVVLETDIGKKKRETQDEGEVQVNAKRHQYRQYRIL